MGFNKKFDRAPRSSEKSPAQVYTLDRIGGDVQDSFQSRRPSRQKQAPTTDTFSSVMALDLQPKSKLNQTMMFTRSQTPLHTLLNSQATRDPKN